MKNNKIIINHYNKYNEKDRLSFDRGQLEFVRTKEILTQYLPEPPAVILDIGGAAGIYSCWLAKKGYEVHLIDPVPKHVEQAKQASKDQPGFPIAGFRIGDARDLDYKSSFANIVLLMGPLYHLLEYEDRLAALRESCRILKKGGLLFAAGISRFASCIDGLTFEFCKDPEFQKILHQDLETGHHKNPTNNEFYFTDGYFHRPEELNSEIAAAGFKPTAIHAIEGIAYMIKDFEKNWHDKKYREVILDIIRRIDREASLLGASPHIMCVACKK